MRSSTASAFERGLRCRRVPLGSESSAEEALRKWGRLSTQQRDVIVLLCYARLTVPEIAARRATTEAGQVPNVVVPPPDPVEYTPSAGEVSLALVFAACADEIDFVARLDAAQSSAMAQFAARHEPTIAGLLADLERLDRES